MANALCGIVYHHRQLIRPKAIGTQQHKIAHLLRQLLAVVAHHRIVKANILRRHAHPPSGRLGGFRLPENIQPRTMAAIHRPIYPHARRLRQHVFAAAIAWIKQIFVFQRLQRGTV